MKHPTEFLMRSNMAPQWMRYTVTSVNGYGFGTDIAHFDNKADAELFIEAKKKQCPTLHQKEVAPEVKP